MMVIDVFFIFYFSAYYIRLLITTQFILKPLTAEKRYLQGSERPEFFLKEDLILTVGTVVMSLRNKIPENISCKVLAN